MGKLELSGGHIEIMHYIEMEKQELIGRHIENILFIENMN